MDFWNQKQKANHYLQIILVTFSTTAVDVIDYSFFSES